MEEKISWEKVTNAVNNINTIITNEVIGLSVFEQIKLTSWWSQLMAQRINPD